MNKTISIRISEETKKELQEISKTEQKPVSDLVRDSLRKFIAIRRFRKLRNMTLPFAEAQGILIDEKVLKIIR